MVNTKYIIRFLLVISVFSGSFTWLWSQPSIPDDFCIHDGELKLFNLINAYRKQNKLADIPLSRSLCYIARLHVEDLNKNRPDTAGCNLHSWSDKGHWAECCYGRDRFNNTCMTSKPMELTRYPGSGYEIAFWESVDAEPEIVLDLWKSTPASNDLILNAGIWKDKSWKAIGTGIKDGYAVVWFGNEPDVEGGVKICNSSELIVVPVTEPKISKPVAGKPASKASVTRYYLIGASFKDKTQAQAEVERLRSRGFKNPKVLPAGENFRVSLGDYSTYEEALEAKQKLFAKYKDLWILKN